MPLAVKFHEIEKDILDAVRCGRYEDAKGAASNSDSDTEDESNMDEDSLNVTVLALCLCHNNKYQTMVEVFHFAR